MMSRVPHKKSRDFIDLVKIIQWLLTFNSFVETNSNLRSLPVRIKLIKTKICKYTNKAR